MPAMIQRNQISQNRRHPPRVTNRILQRPQFVIKIRITHWPNDSKPSQLVGWWWSVKNPYLAKPKNPQNWLFSCLVVGRGKLLIEGTLAPKQNQFRWRDCYWLPCLLLLLLRLQIGSSWQLGPGCLHNFVHKIATEGGRNSIRKFYFLNRQTHFHPPKLFSSSTTAVHQYIIFYSNYN